MSTRRAVVFPLLLLGLAGTLGPGLAPAPALALADGRFSMEVLVDGRALPELPARGTTYVEAPRGREYSIRLTNHTGRRVAVALAVDGLNSIDARRTSAREARKWVVPPYGSITIDGWQTDAATAKRFFFTTEPRSYGAWLGRTDDLGVISAAFFAERAPEVTWSRDRSGKETPEAQARAQDGARGESAPAPSAGRADAAETRASAKAETDDYAATGSGRRVGHAVHEVQLDLEDVASASFDLRYEYHDALVKLGVLPRDPAPLARRERATGFGGFCPDPGR